MCGEFDAAAKSVKVNTEHKDSYALTLYLKNCALKSDGNVVQVVQLGADGVSRVYVRQ